MKLDDLFSIITDEKIAEANQRHDLEHGQPKDWAKIRSGWNEGKLLGKGDLTDKKIAKYEDKGWYDAEFKLARKQLMEKRQSKRMTREGNFLIREDGSKIYQPL